MPPSASPTPGAPALTVRGLSVDFATDHGLVRAVRSVDLDVAPGELVALLGESGSGKSVTARSVLGLAGAGAEVSADVLEVGGTPVLALSPDGLRRIRGERVGLVMQDALSALNPVLTVGEQIAEILRVHRGIGRRAATARATELLALVGIPAPARRVRDHPHQFSGGMRQRILIAMAIALEPELLIADEPTTALDVTVQAQVLELLDDLRHRLGMAVLLITHDLGVVMETSDRVAVMYAGRVVETGPTTEVLSSPRHPYTEALLRSVPSRAGRDRLLTIPGSPPSPTLVPPGCSFHPRCRLAVERCRDVRPDLLTVLPGRAAACHRSDELVEEVRDVVTVG